MKKQAKYPFIALLKPGILFHALLTLSLGYYLALAGKQLDISHYVYTLLGVGLVAAGAAALNHVLEKKIDARMSRTKHRPIASGQISVFGGAIYSVCLILSGMMLLYFKINTSVTILSFCTVLLYDGLYTYLKRITWWNTFLGAIPGALPPLCGWFALRDDIQIGIILLFAIFYVWQLPHFFSIAWVYKQSYQEAGLKMLSTEDASGLRTCFQLGFHFFILALLTALFYMYVELGFFYVLIMLINNGYFLWTILSFFKDKSQQKAKQVMMASILYQPVFILAVYVSMKSL